MISVLYATDSAFWPYVFVSLYSVLKSNPNRTTRAFVMCEKRDATFDSRVAFLASLGNLDSLTIIDVNALASSFEMPTPPNHVTLATYHRFMLGRALPENPTRVLYLDGNTVTGGSLDELIDIDLEGHLLAVAPAYVWKEHIARLGLVDGSVYFNAGVMLVDLARKRSLNAEDLLSQYVKAHREQRRSLGFASAG